MNTISSVKNNPLSGKLVPLLIFVLIGATFAIGALWQKVQYLEKSETAPVGTGNSVEQPQRADVDIKDVDLSGEPFIGKKNAPVTLAYWFDFQCPFCKQFDTVTLPDLVKNYVETGKLKVVFKDFQFLGPDSQTAGIAAHAIWELYPDKYISWHTAMFEKQDAENGGWGTKEDIIALTATISGIDSSKVSKLMDSKKEEFQKEQDADKAEGGKFNISGTPGFVVGTQSISGAQPIGVFTQIIDAELSQ